MRERVVNKLRTRLFPIRMFWFFSGCLFSSLPSLPVSCSFVFVFVLFVYILRTNKNEEKRMCRKKNRNKIKLLFTSEVIQREQQCRIPRCVNFFQFSWCHMVAFDLHTHFSRNQSTARIFLWNYVLCVFLLRSYERVRAFSNSLIPTFSCTAVLAFSANEHIIMVQQRTQNTHTGLLFG